MHFLQDKILLSSGRDASLMVTNDGATILKNIGVDNPAAKVLVGESEDNIVCSMFWLEWPYWLNVL